MYFLRHEVPWMSWHSFDIMTYFLSSGHTGTFNVMIKIYILYYVTTYFLTSWCTLYHYVLLISWCTSYLLMLWHSLENQGIWRKLDNFRGKLGNLIGEINRGKNQGILLWDPMILHLDCSQWLMWLTFGQFPVLANVNSLALCMDTSCIYTTQPPYWLLMIRNARYIDS